MHNLVFAKSLVQFNTFMTAVDNRCSEKAACLWSRSLLYGRHWPGHYPRDRLILVSYTTNRVETENRHLKERLLNRSMV